MAEGAQQGANRQGAGCGGAAVGVEVGMNGIMVAVGAGDGGMVAAAGINASAGSSSTTLAETQTAPCPTDSTRYQMPLLARASAITGRRSPASARATTG